MAHHYRRVQCPIHMWISFWNTFCTWLEFWCHEDPPFTQEFYYLLSHLSGPHYRSISCFYYSYLICHCLYLSFLIPNVNASYTVQLESYLESGARQFGFMLRGLKELEPAFADLNIPFFLVKGDATKTIPKFIKEHKAACLVTDFAPMRDGRAWRDTVRIYNITVF